MQTEAATAFDQVFELAAVVSELMRHTLAEHGLTTVRADVLLVLDAQGALVQRELSQALHCTPRHVTALIDALETDGWVSRQPHPTDRRATLVMLTAKGRTAAGTMAEERQVAAQTLFGGLSAPDLASFVAITDQVLRQVRASAAVPPAADPADQPSADPADQPSAESAG